MVIPKLIHQTARSPEFSPLIAHCISTLREQNPNWEYRLYTDEDWKEVITGDSLLNWDDFVKFPSGILKADIFRCAVLFERGGLYADVDVMGVRRIEAMIEHASEVGIIPEDTEVILTTDHPIHSRLFFGSKDIYMNNFMLAKPGARLLEIFLKEMKEAVRTSALTTHEPLAVTGPPAITRIIHQYGGLRKLKIAVVPYFWINSLPDMTVPFPERPIFRKMIDDGSWREIYCPYFVHLWWHSYVNVETEVHYEAFWKNPSPAVPSLS